MSRGIAIGCHRVELGTARGREPRVGGLGGWLGASFKYQPEGDYPRLAGLMSGSRRIRNEFAKPRSPAMAGTSRAN